MWREGSSWLFVVVLQISWFLQSWRALPKVFVLPISLLSASVFPLGFCGTPPLPALFNLPGPAAHKVLKQPEKLWRNKLGSRQHLSGLATSVRIGNICQGLPHPQLSVIPALRTVPCLAADDGVRKQPCCSSTGGYFLA